MYSYLGTGSHSRLTKTVAVYSVKEVTTLSDADIGASQIAGASDAFRLLIAAAVIDLATAALVARLGAKVRAAGVWLALLARALGAAGLKTAMAGSAALRTALAANLSRRIGHSNAIVPSTISDPPAAMIAAAVGLALALLAGGALVQWQRADTPTAAGLANALLLGALKGGCSMAPSDGKVPHAYRLAALAHSVVATCALCAALMPWLKMTYAVDISIGSAPESLSSMYPQCGHRGHHSTNVPETTTPVLKTHPNPEMLHCTIPCTVMYTVDLRKVHYSATTTTTTSYTWQPQQTETQTQDDEKDVGKKFPTAVTAFGLFAVTAAISLAAPVLVGALGARGMRAHARATSFWAAAVSLALSSAGLNVANTVADGCQATVGFSDLNSCRYTLPGKA